MPMVQAAILRAVSGLDDSLGFSTLVPDVRTVGLCDREDAAPYRLLPYSSHPAGSLAALLVTLVSPASGRSEARTNDDLSSGELMARYMQMKETVSFCHNSSQCRVAEGS
jgi:hypothetical protein